jgi:hypothetical protein
MRTGILLLALLAPVGYISTAKSETSPVGFKSVAEAFDAVKSEPGAKVNTTESDKWTIVNLNTVDGGMVQWSFTPKAHYAHPAVAKRTIKVGTGGDVYLESSYLCEAEKEPCDRLVSEFQVLNDQIRNNIQRRFSRGQK